MDYFSPTQFPPESPNEEIILRNQNLFAKAWSSGYAQLAKAIEIVRSSIIIPGIFGGYAVNDIRYYGTIERAVSMIGSASSTLYITNTQTVSANLTIPSNILVVILNGGSFAIGNGVTLTIHRLESGRHPAFTRTGTGTVRLVRPGTVYPEMFGAIGGLSIDDNAAFAFMASACANSEACTISLGAEGYLCGDVVAFSNMKGLKIIGPGHASGNDELAKVKLTGVGSAGSPKGWTFANCLFELENIFFEGAGSNAGATLAEVTGNYGITTGPAGGSATGGVNFLVNKCFFQFFDEAIRIRGVSYVWWVHRNYMNWNRMNINVVGGVDEDSIVHGLISENTFAETSIDIHLEKCSQITVTKNHWENNIWPPIATYAASTSNSVNSIYAETDTRAITISYNQGLRPVGYTLNTARTLVVHGNSFESQYKAFAIRIGNALAQGVSVANNMIWCKINNSNDFGGIGTGVVGGIYSDADADITDNTILIPSIGIEMVGKGGNLSGNTIVDPYLSQTGRTHTGDGIGIRWANNATKAMASGNRVISSGIDWGSGVITSSRALSSTGVATKDIYVIDPIIDLTGVTDPFNAAGGRLIVLGYEMSGTPEGAVSASPGSIIRRTDPGQNAGIYHKLSGNGNTGYVASVSTDASGDAGVARNLIVGQLASLTDADAINLAGASAKAIGIVNTGNGASNAVFGSIGWGRLSLAGGGTRAGAKALRRSTNYTADGNIGLYLGLYASEDGDGDGTLVASVRKSGVSIALGRGLSIAEGSNAKAGVATLVAGTVTVNTSAVAAGDRILLFRQANNASTALGELVPGTITAGTSFVINSYSLLAALETGDLSTVYWEIRTP